MNLTLFAPPDQGASENACALLTEEARFAAFAHDWDAANVRHANGMYRRRLARLVSRPLAAGAAEGRDHVPTK